MKQLQGLEGKGYNLSVDNIGIQVQYCSLIWQRRRLWHMALCELAGKPYLMISWTSRTKRSSPRKGNSVYLGRKADSLLAHGRTTMLATSECSTVTRAVKEKGQWVQKEVQRPAIVELYNRFMGGVDMADQRVRSYQCNTKSYVWYTKLFFYFFGSGNHEYLPFRKKEPTSQPRATQKARPARNLSRS